MAEQTAPSPGPGQVWNSGVSPSVLLTDAWNSTTELPLSQSCTLCQAGPLQVPRGAGWAGSLGWGELGRKGLPTTRARGRESLPHVHPGLLWAGSRGSREGARSQDFTLHRWPRGSPRLLCGPQDPAGGQLEEPRCGALYCLLFSWGLTTGLGRAAHPPREWGCGTPSRSPPLCLGDPAESCREVRGSWRQQACFLHV